MSDLLAHLRELERRLQSADHRSSEAWLLSVLHPEFVEFGRSGTPRDRAETIAVLNAEAPTTLWSQDFRLHHAHAGHALVHYRSATLQPDGLLTRYSLRSSLWVFADDRWQLLFHQGTPTVPFQKRAAT